jgi:hypothetical protein
MNCPLCGKPIEAGDETVTVAVDQSYVAQAHKFTTRQVVKVRTVRKPAHKQCAQPTEPVRNIPEGHEFCLGCGEWHEPPFGWNCKRGET